MRQRESCLHIGLLSYHCTIRNFVSVLLTDVRRGNEDEIHWSIVVVVCDIVRNVY